MLVFGRRWTQCPRCSSTNTRSFRQLKEEGSEAALWGLEQIVKKYPRSEFEVKTSGDSERVARSQEIRERDRPRAS